MSSQFLIFCHFYSSKLNGLAVSISIQQTLFFQLSRYIFKITQIGGPKAQLCCFCMFFFFATFSLLFDGFLHFCPRSLNLQNSTNSRQPYIIWSSETHLLYFYLYLKTFADWCAISFWKFVLIQHFFNNSLIFPNFWMTFQAKHLQNHFYWHNLFIFLLTKVRLQPLITKYTRRIEKLFGFLFSVGKTHCWVAQQFYVFLAENLNFFE